MAMTAKLDPAVEAVARALFVAKHPDISPDFTMGIGHGPVWQSEAYNAQVAITAYKAATEQPLPVREWQSSFGPQTLSDYTVKP